RHRMALRHVRAFDDDAVGIHQAARIHRRGAAPHAYPQTGDTGAVSDAGLVLDGDHAEAAHELLLEVVPLVVHRGAAEREDGQRVVHHLAVGQPLDERLVAGLLHQLRHAVHRAVEVPLLPGGRAGRAVQYFGQAVRVHVELIGGRALGAEVAHIDGAGGVALDVDDLAVNGVDERPAAHRAVRAHA